MWITNGDGFYIQAIHGARFVTWVNINATENALIFPEDEIHNWIIVLEDMTGESLRSEMPTRIFGRPK